MSEGAGQDVPAIRILPVRYTLVLSLEPAQVWVRKTGKVVQTILYPEGREAGGGYEILSTRIAGG